MIRFIALLGALCFVPVAAFFVVGLLLPIFIMVAIVWLFGWAVTIPFRR